MRLIHIIHLQKINRPTIIYYWLYYKKYRATNGKMKYLMSQYNWIKGIG